MKATDNNSALANVKYSDNIIKPVPIASENLGASTSVGYMTNGDYLEYPSVDFGAGVSEFDIYLGVAAGKAGAIIDCRIDSPTGRLLCSIKATETGGYYTYKNFKAQVAQAVTGVHNLYLVLHVQGPANANIKSFTFLPIGAATINPQPAVPTVPVVPASPAPAPAPKPPVVATGPTPTPADYKLPAPAFSTPISLSNQPHPSTNVAVVDLGGFRFTAVPDQAGGVVHVSAINKSGNFIAAKNLNYKWDFGDPTGTYNSLPGWNASHFYQNPGTYTVSLTIDDGKAGQKFQRSLTIAKDSRPVINVKTIADIITNAAKGNVRIICPASVFKFTGTQSVTVSHTRNVTIESADPKNPATFSLALDANLTLLQTWWDTANLVIRNIKIVGDNSKYAQYMGHPFTQQWMGWIRGYNVSVIGCVFDKVLEGIQSQPGMPFMHIENNSSPDVWSVTNSPMWIEGCHIVQLGNSFKKGCWENTNRTADGGAEYLLLAYNVLAAAHLIAPFPLKSPCTWRTIRHAYAYANVFTDSFVAVESRGPDVEGWNLSFDLNTFNNSQLILRAQATDILIKNNIFNEYVDGPCIEFDSPRNGQSVTGVEAYGNKFNMTSKRSALGDSGATKSLPTDVTKYNVPITTYNEHDNQYSYVVPVQPQPAPIS